MSLAFNLEKSTQNLQFNLEKKSVKEFKPCQVHLTFDVSGSFDDEHRDGYTQELLNRFVPFAMLFDKDKKLGSYIFSNNSTELKDVDVHNYDNYVRSVIMRSQGYGGGTAYSPIFKDLVEASTHSKSSGFLGGIFGKGKQEQEKHLHIFVTDGEANDQERSKDILNDLMGKTDNVFFVFLSVYPNRLPFFDNYYANTKYSTYINFTKCELMQLGNLTDEDLYDMLLVPQLIEWMNK